VAGERVPEQQHAVDAEHHRSLGSAQQDAKHFEGVALSHPSSIQTVVA
jgi:hypothetical protein